MITRILTAINPVSHAAGAVSRYVGWPPYNVRVRTFLEHRAHYAYGVFFAADLAKRLGHRRMSVIEFGVAGGLGLLNLERHGRAAGRHFGIEIEIYGFDTGEGLPSPVDSRDLPYHWRRGFFKMDHEKLISTLKSAHLVLGDVASTLENFGETHNPAPVGFIAHDLDFYSSTVASMSIFDLPPRYRLPRILNYFDDTIGTHIELYCEFTGQLAAIKEYNDANQSKKIGECRSLIRGPFRAWHKQMFVHHDFGHPDYDRFISEESQQLHLK